MFSFRTQRGVALILVLWLSILLSILVASFAIVARTEVQQSRFLFDTVRADYGAQAGLHRAVYEMRNPDFESRWIPDGRTYEVTFDDIQLEISLTDESGKIDLNAADLQTLLDLFLSVGLDEQKSQELADAIIDWRDPDELTGVYGAEDEDYEAAGFPYGASDAPFATVSEVQQVMGMTYEIYQMLEPALTVYTGRGRPEAAFAPPEVLRAIPGMNEGLVEDFIAQREQNSEIGVPLPVLPDGTAPVAQSGGYTYSVRSRATLPNGVWSELEATVRLGGSVNGRPFRIVRWNDS